MCIRDRPGVHPGIVCDGSGEGPIAGWRFHLIGEDYDLCEAEWRKLPETERARYQRMAPTAPPPETKGA